MNSGTDHAIATTTLADYQVSTLGPCEYDSPLACQSWGDLEHFFVDDGERILLDERLSSLNRIGDPALAPSLELAGPRRRIFFPPAHTSVGIVTCGGLCPGLNDVIRGVVMTAHYRYGIEHIYGFRFGYWGVANPEGVIELTPKLVSDIHESGGTFLGSSRGDQDPAVMVDRLQALGVRVLFVIGGDGTIRGALAIAAEARRRQFPLAVIGVPKTIDNDIQMIDQSFGFETAYATAMHAVRSAHVEARGANNGVGVVKLMGRHSGFIACHAALATSHVNFVLIPEVPFRLAGPGGFLDALQQRLERRRHAVVLVAEGAGQDLLANDGAQRDASGNVKLRDIGSYLCEQIRGHAATTGFEVNLKYIDPSYIIRSVPANPFDSVYCWRLAENAVHAGLSGKTEMVVGQWHGRLVNVPMQRAIAGRKRVDPRGDLWWSVLESTGQPSLA